jgi:predicted secreted protein
MGATCGGDGEPTRLLASEQNRVAVGDEMEIHLSAEPGLGDAWQVATPPDETVVRLVDQRSESDEPELAGGLWEDVFVFEAVGPGTTEVVVHNCFRCDDQGNTPPEYAEEAVDLTYAIIVE